MGNGFGRTFKLSLLAIAGLSGLVSCAGPGRQPAGIAADARGDGTGTAASASWHQGPVKVEDSSDLAGLQRQFEAVARRVIPSVVAISAIDVPIVDATVLHPDECSVDRLNAALASHDRTVGTGFVIDAAEGYVVTNEHVVGRTKQIWVTTDDQKVYPAVVVGSDPRSDLAVLKIPARNLTAVRFAKSPARRGQWTMAIGNPYGLAGDGEMAVSVGVVSAVGRSLPKLSGKEDRLYQDLLQTTAQINPGNSGGPLFDLNGDVVGINCAVILPVKQTNGIGFALPLSQRVRSVINRLKAGGEVTYAYLGVRTSTPSEADFRTAGVTDLRGARVDFVEPNSPAQDAGFAVGDIVRAVDGAATGDSELFVQTIGDAPIGMPVKISIHRGGKPVTLSVTLRPREQSAVPVTGRNQQFAWRGLILGPRAGSAGVAVLDVLAGSPLAGSVKRGDVVESLGGVRLSRVQDVIDALAGSPLSACAVKVATAAPTPGVATARE